MVKKIVRLIAFFALLLIVLRGLNEMFKFKYGDGIYGLKTYYELPTDTVDVLVLGSSHAFEDINPAVLYEEYGIAAYDLCGSAQALWNTYWYLKEALKSQTPKLIVLEAWAVVYDAEYLDPSCIIKNTYGMKWSRDKIEALKVSAPPEETLDFLIGPLQYHGRYAELSEADFLPYQGKAGLWEYWKGFGNNMKIQAQSAIDVSHVELPIELHEKSERYYRQIIELSQEAGIPMIIVVTPFCGINDEQQGKYLRAAEIASEYGIPFINYNMQVDEIGLDYGTDFADIGHMSYLGNRKFTEYFGRYLAAHYDLPDRRGEEEWISWEMNLKYYRESLWGKELQSYTNLEEYLANMPTEDCVTVITASDKEVWDQGNYEEYGYVTVKYGDSALYKENDLKEAIWHADIDGVDFAVRATAEEDMEGTAKAGYRINVGLSEYQKVADGVNIMIYNIFTDEVVDAVGFTEGKIVR